MKRLLLFLFLAPSLCQAFKIQDSCFTGAVTAGYVFRNHDCIFDEVYGLGLVNAITVDGCYNVREHWGLGAKVSYWFAKGRTTFLQQCTHLQQVPITFYLRGMADLKRDVRLYLSLGGGTTWVKEKSYLGTLHAWRGIGEAEVGFFCSTWQRVNFTAALRYIFCGLFQCHANVGGFDLRAGFSYSY